MRQAVGYGAQASAHAAELALHFARGRDVPRALRYIQQAAENALRRYAYQEAIDHFTRGLEVLQTMPETPERVQRELAIQLALGPVFLAIKGHASPEMQRTYGRVQALCQQVGDTPQHFLALWGLCLVQLVAGKLQTTRALVADLLRLAQRLQERDTSWKPTVPWALSCSVWENLPRPARIWNRVWRCTTPSSTESTPAPMALTPRSSPSTIWRSPCGSSAIPTKLPGTPRRHCGGRGSWPTSQV
jgi:hypothetical protein